MSDKELQELQDPESWSDESEVRPAVKPQRAVVSVSFSREDLDRVAEHAQREGMKTSEFIRQAALNQASERPTQVHVFSASGQVRTDIPFTRRHTPQARVEFTMRQHGQEVTLIPSH
jgi:predicted DNA binding CopG/RHH family protein